MTAAKKNLAYPEIISPLWRKLIDWQNPHDPLRLQVEKSTLENQILPDEKEDPLEDQADEVAPGLIHRYPGKTLWLTTNNCAANCRFCLRKAQRKNQANQTLNQLPAIINYLKNHPGVKEIIFSGGDPLTLNSATTQKIVTELLKLPSLEIFRWHTRLPVFAPEKVARDFDALWQNLIQQGKSVKIVLHLNHPAEITPELLRLVKNWQKIGIKMLAQGVLLKNVNDQPEVLAQLWQKELEAGITPYYLYHLDQVIGSGWQRIEMEEGLKIIAQTQKILSPQIPLPKYVVDLPKQGKFEVTQLLKKSP